MVDRVDGGVEELAAGGFFVEEAGGDFGEGVEVVERDGHEAGIDEVSALPGGLKVLVHGDGVLAAGEPDAGVPALFVGLHGNRHFLGPEIFGSQSSACLL